ncbi:MAG: 16S rRNA (uracil(1498)-N(3))-methyltransferase [Bacteroidetes bacterium]|nr:MAG: 16S rRNA (uracil(1498)-N(3))-methyltransferase [Bacteroidota bacterium]
MSLPFFYIESYDASAKTIILDEDTSRHVVQVLRMQKGEKLNLTDGKGSLLNCEISDAHKKHCTVKAVASSIQHPASKKITVAISLVKNTSRFEWFLEKATEIGVSEIIPLICERTEKQKFRHDRMKTICVSAMLQSQQTWLPVLSEPKQFADLLMCEFADYKKLIAHCIEGEKQALSHSHIRTSAHQLILIGPEGDFTSIEINLALENNFIPVSLGETRLRTETAGIVAATLLKLG